MCRFCFSVALSYGLSCLYVALPFGAITKEKQKPRTTVVEDEESRPLTLQQAPITKFLSAENQAKKIRKTSEISARWLMIEQTTTTTTNNNNNNNKTTMYKAQYQ